MRNRICITALRRTALICLGAAAAVAAIAVGFWGLLQLEPPLMDENALSGTPADLPKEMGYATYDAAEVCAAALCGNPKVDGKDVWLYLTNPTENNVAIRGEIYSVKFKADKTGQIVGADPDVLLGKSGFIRPGDYVEKITLKTDLQGAETPIMIKIATYEEATQESQGFFFLNTTFNPKVPPEFPE